MNLNLKKSTSFVGGNASPFIDEGDGFTGERKRVRMLQNLVAHADEEWIMVGAYNTVDVTVECQVYVGGLRWLLHERWTSVPVKYCWYVRSPTTCTRYGGSWRPLSMPRGTGGLLPYGSPTTPAIL